MLSRLLTRKEQYVLLALAASVSVGSLAIYVHHRVGSGVNPAGEVIQREEEILRPRPREKDAAPIVIIESAPIEVNEAEGESVVVSLDGAVDRPGVYSLEKGARIQDLLEMAGGPLPAADMTDINLAARLVDETTLVIPPKYEAETEEELRAVEDDLYRASLNPPEYTLSRRHLAAPRGGAVGIGGARSSPMGLINVNTATQAELESLPGIGPKYAQEIIRYRAAAPFQRVEDLMNVKGIGPKRLEALRPLVSVQ